MVVALPRKGGLNFPQGINSVKNPKVAVQSVREWGQPDVPAYGDIQLVGFYQNASVWKSLYNNMQIAIFDCACENKAYSSERKKIYENITALFRTHFILFSFDKFNFSKI